MRTYPPGSRFHPTDLGLVKLHLKHKVEKNISGFIKTMNVYGDAPWRLDHDTNPLYPRNEWFYFVPRTMRGTKTVSRMVPSNGESLGGTWKSVVKKQEIKNKHKKLMGYKTELVFNKNVVGETDKKKTDWHMNEYSFHTEAGEEFHDLVLCHIRLLHSAERFKPIVPAHHHVVENNNVLPNQEQQEAVGFNNQNDMTMMLENEGGDVNQHQQQQQQEQEQENSLIHLHDHPFQSNNNNNNQERYLLEHIVYNKNDMTMLENDRGDVNQQQQQQQEQEDSLRPPLQSKVNLEQVLMEATADDGHETFDLDDEFKKLLNEGYDHFYQQKQQQEQQDSPAPLLPPLQSNVNHGQCPSVLVPSQVENNNTVLPNQEQQEEAGFANQNDMWTMVEKEDGDVKQHEQQEEEHKDSPAPLQINDNQEHCPYEDYAFDAADDYLTCDVDELLKILNEWIDQKDSSTLLLQSSNNHGQCPSQVENHNNNNNNTFLPNQDQQEEAGFANQKDMPMMVEKEHGDVNQHQQQQEQEQEQENLDQALTPQQLQQLEIFIKNLNMSF